MLAAVILSLFSQMEDWKRDLSSNVATLDAGSPDPRMHPPIVPESVQEVQAKIIGWADQTPLWSVESSDSTDQEAKIHLTRTTRVFGWVDDIHVLVRAEDDGTHVDAESRSRVGKGDLGQNPRNLRALLAGMQVSESDK